VKEIDSAWSPATMNGTEHNVTIHSNDDY